MQLRFQVRDARELQLHVASITAECYLRTAPNLGTVDHLGTLDPAGSAHQSRSLSAKHDDPTSRLVHSLISVAVEPALSTTQQT